MIPPLLSPPPTSHQCTFETQPTPNETILRSPCLVTIYADIHDNSAEMPNAGRGREASSLERTQSRSHSHISVYN